MHIDEQHDWMDGFGSWEEVWACLHDDWVRVVDVRQRLELERDADELLVVEVDRRLRARQRRDLHRLGFRPVPIGRVTAWRWSPAEAVRRADPADSRHPLLALPETLGPAPRPGWTERLRTRLMSEELVSRQVQRVVQDVFQSAPTDVAVVALPEPGLWADDWDDAEEETWQLPGR